MRGLTTVSVLTVALGVGSCAALFSVVKAVLLQPLPYADPGALAWIASTNQGSETSTSLVDFDAWRAQNHSFVSMAAYSDGPFLTAGGDAPERTRGALVTDGFFETLGVQPALGRVFSAEEHAKGDPFAHVIIGHGLWQRAYGKDPAIIGRKITVLGWPATVIGVMPAGFAFPEGSELWTSVRPIHEPYTRIRTAHNFSVFGRLRPGVTVDAANREIDGIATRLKAQYPDPFQTPHAAATSLAAHLTGNVRTPMLLLFGAVGTLLVIVCINVSNLLLVRGTDRARELAVRLAMGAGQWRLFRQLIIESLLLAAAGGALGILIAVWSVDLLRILIPSTVPRVGDVEVDGWVIAFAIVVAAGAGVLFGTLPSWQASLININESLRSRARGAGSNRLTRQTQRALVVSQVALAMLLLAGAGLLVGTFLRLRAVDPGFRAEGVLAGDLSFPMRADETQRIAPRYDDLLARVRALPGVVAAGTSRDLPLETPRSNGRFFIDGRPAEIDLQSGYRIVSPQFMDALRIPILRGRGFTDADTADAPLVAVVNAEMAKRYWPDRDPLGERVWFERFDPKPARWFTIVGVVGDVRHSGLIEPVQPEAYVSYPQIRFKGMLGTGHLLVRTAGDPTSLVPALRRIVRAVQPDAAITFRTMDDVLAGATARQRFQMRVLAAFAAMALTLAIIGLYGVLSYTVNSDRRSIGIRMALGAQPFEVFRMVVAGAFWLTALGAAAGLLACFALRGVLQTVVYGVGPNEPGVLGATVAILLVTALAACSIPAYRAMNLDPGRVLREE